MRVRLEVDAWIVDANGAFFRLEGFPEPYDSIHYNNDTERTLNKALSKAWKTFGDLIDDNSNRQIKTVVVRNVYGINVFEKSTGDYTVNRGEQL